jgi:SpoVK/Ycf46/Vps4 family AAA+-type ATPase
MIILFSTNVGNNARPTNNSHNNSNPNNNNKNSVNIDTSSLKHIDQKLIDIVTNDLMDNESKVSWNDIAGLVHVKQTIKEIVIWPMMRPV